MSSVTSQEYIENWLLQKNYPEVTISIEPNSLTGNTKVMFSQRRFILSQDIDPEIDTPSPYG